MLNKKSRGSVSPMQILLLASIVLALVVTIGSPLLGGGPEFGEAVKLGEYTAEEDRMWNQYACSSRTQLDQRINCPADPINMKGFCGRGIEGEHLILCGMQKASLIDSCVDGNPHFRCDLNSFQSSALRESFGELNANSVGACCPKGQIGVCSYGNGNGEASLSIKCTYLREPPHST